MRRFLRSARRAPARIAASLFALALAVGAIGVFAIPTVSTSSLRDAAERDGIPNVVIGVDDSAGVDLRRLTETVDGVDRIEAQTLVTVGVATGPRAGVDVDVLGVPVDQEIDVLRLDAGRPPSAAGEIVVDGDLPLGSVVALERADGSTLDTTVVGHGTTSSWADESIVFATAETAAHLAGIDGANRLVVRAEEGRDESELRSIADELRDRLVAVGVAPTYLPVVIESGTHPIEADVEQVSSLIGLLGIVAGVVGLVLLASTTNTLVAERTREVAVMRALGAPPRALRRRLRRIALGIAAGAVVIGVPLGVVISNVIARMVLEEFVGLTPALAVSVPVMVASAAFALVGARVVAARSARRVVGLPLATALRDRDGRPYGRRWSERVAARFGVGRPLDRTALRNGVHQRARSLAIAAQIGAAVAALLIVASMATTINDFNDAELEPWNWASTTYVAGPGLDIAAGAADDDPRSETAIEVTGEARGWEVDVFGFEPATTMVDRAVEAGRWYTEPRDAVVSAGFARAERLDVGDEIVVDLATGEHTYEIVGLHGNRGRELYVDRDVLAADLGGAGLANRLLSLDVAPAVDLPGRTGVIEYDALEADDSGRSAILLIFGAIGVIVVAVAGLAVASGLVVNIHERRHEFAALRAIGGRRRHVLRIVWLELLALATLGLAAGVAGGYWGGREVARSFERSNAVEIGFVFAGGAVPYVGAVVLAGTFGLGLLAVRRVTRRPIAVTLRSAA